MTDEEMAKEYAHKHTYHEVAKREDGTEYAKEVLSVDIGQAFLDGLKIGGQRGIKAIDTESMLKELLDRGVIRSWYYNGSYHVGSELPR